jgi:hypothetical protein
MTETRADMPRDALARALEEHWPTLVFEEGDGDLCRCSCGEQGFDFKQGREWFAAHLDVARSGSQAEEPPLPDPTWAHTPQNDPAGLYDDSWEYNTGSQAVPGDRLREALHNLRRSWEGRCSNPRCPSQHEGYAPDCTEAALVEVEAAALGAEPVAPPAPAPEPSWSFKKGTLRDRLEWARDQHQLMVEWMDVPGHKAEAASQSFHRACVDWYADMIRQYDEPASSDVAPLDGIKFVTPVQAGEAMHDAFRELAPTAHLGGPEGFVRIDVIHQLIDETMKALSEPIVLHPDTAGEPGERTT